jgi:RNA polymerase sigma-70 factor (ECF subfamily)
MLPLPIEEALTRARAGDRGALSVVLESLEPRLLRMVELRLEQALRRRLEPRDIVQEALLEAARRFDEWRADPRIPFHSWLRLICAQALTNAQRKHLGTQKREAAREQPLLDRPSVSAANAADFFVASQTSPSQAATRSEARALVLNALLELEEMDREILALRHFEGLSNDEAAVELGIEPAAASKRFARALQRLRPALRALETS